MIDKATTYIKEVLSGEIVTGKWIKLAMERHMADLKRQRTPDFPFYFDEEEAERILNLYSLFRFSKGDVSGAPFDLMPWFAALVYMAYGWRRPGGGKRFRKVYCKVARGNAKTANLVTIGTIGFLFEGVADAEVYWVAMNKEQAKIGWDRQREMLKMLVEDYPELESEIYIPDGKTSSRMSRTTGLSWVGYYGQDSKGRDGLSPYYVLADEYHEWESNYVLDRLQSGMIKVKDPVTWLITTAGYNPLGPNSEFLKACKNMLLGVVKAEDTLAFIYELDEDDDWQDRSVWIKANPGLGISLDMVGLETEFDKIATEGRGKEIDFKVKNLNIEQSTNQGWIDDEIWMKGSRPLPMEELRERECWGGLDLANTNDFNAFVLFFPPRWEGDEAYVLPWFWVPENAVEKFHQKRPFVRNWAAEGYLKTTPGNVTDYDILLYDILDIIGRYPMFQGISFDKALSAYLAPRLIEQGVRLEPYIPSPLNMTVAAKPVERLCLYEKRENDVVVLQNLLVHGGHPVLRWMMINVTMVPTNAGNYYPSKGHSMEKIDGVSAMLYAVGLWLDDRGEPRYQDVFIGIY